MSHFHFYANPSEYRWIFFRLWTTQNRFHWLLTLSLPCRVNRFRPITRQMWAKGGSAIASRMAYMARPTAESILRFIFSMHESLAFSVRPSKRATCRISVLSGWRSHCCLRVQGRQADFGPLKLIERSPLVTTLPPLRYRRLPAGQRQ